MNDYLPDNGGYVAAAYLVFLALLLIYFGIMAYKLTRIERQVAELNELADRLAAEREQAAEGDGAREREATRA
jgi:outer membrane murein-binding lipoprotein Lpp